MDKVAMVGTFVSSDTSWALLIKGVGVIRNLESMAVLDDQVFVQAGEHYLDFPKENLQFCKKSAWGWSWENIGDGIHEFRPRGVIARGN